jgi:hypothetical protein
MRPTISNSLRYVSRESAAGLLRGVLVFVFVLLLISLALFQARGQVVESNSKALEVLRRYVDMRLRNDGWKKYSPFITWPDEPGWDCYWVAKSREIGVPAYGTNTATVPVTYRRLGLSCNNLEFDARPSTVTIKYELVDRSDGWKVNGPIPDYPDVQASVLVKELQGIARNVKEIPERRTQASAEARLIAAALNGRE